MTEHIVDTHALYRFLIDSPHMGSNALQVMEAAEQGQGLLIVPSIVMAELYYLNVKHGALLDYATTFQEMTALGCYVFVDFRAAETLRFTALAAVPEMHDRIVVGVALDRGAPILTRDADIVNSGLVQTIW